MGSPPTPFLPSAPMPPARLSIAYRPDVARRPSSVVRGLLALAAGFLLAPALATPPARLPEDPVALVDLRRSGFRDMGDAMKRIIEQVKTGKVPAAVLRDAAAQVSLRAQQLPAWFIGETPVGVGRSRARAAIWTQVADFARLTEEFRRDAAELKSAVASGNAATLRAQTVRVASHCQQCHDTYRE